MGKESFSSSKIVHTITHCTWRRHYKCYIYVIATISIKDPYRSEGVVTYYIFYFINTLIRHSRDIVIYLHRPALYPELWNLKYLSCCLLNKAYVKRGDHPLASIFTWQETISPVSGSEYSPSAQRIPPYPTSPAPLQVAGSLFLISRHEVDT